MEITLQFSYYIFIKFSLQRLIANYEWILYTYQYQLHESYKKYY